MYYKVTEGGAIIDACNGLSYVKKQAKNGIYLSCPAEEATGIISSDGSQVYAIHGCAPVDGLRVVETEEITQEQYDEIRHSLMENGVLADGVSGAEAQDEIGQAEGKSDLLQRLETLESQNEQLASNNEMLFECLLEMSEIVYG